MLILNILLETQNDPRTGKLPSILEGDPSEIRPEKLPPAYVIDVFGDVRATGSYFRKDKIKEWPDVYPARARKSHVQHDVASVAHIEHQVLRGTGNRLGEFFNKDLLPSPAKELTEMHDAKIAEYERMVHGKHYTDIPVDVLERYNKELQDISQKLEVEYKKLKSFKIQVGQDVVEIPNTAPLHPQLPDSLPLLVLFSMTSAGKKAIYRDKHPLVSFDFSTKYVGVESLISETMKLFFEHVEQTAKVSLLDESVFQKSKYLGDLISSQRNLKLLYAFHKNINRSYPTALQDIEERLALIGEKPSPITLESPKEIAVMLYATAKRFEHDPPYQPGKIKVRFYWGKDEVVKRSLSLADKISKAQNMDEAFHLLTSRSGAEVFAQAFHYARMLAHDQNLTPGRIGEDNFPGLGLQLIDQALHAHGEATAIQKPKRIAHPAQLEFWMGLYKGQGR